MSWTKSGSLWENNRGERREDPEGKINTFGMTRVDVNGLTMWENSKGERIACPTDEDNK
jgi:hypothetical protein